MFELPPMPVRTVQALLQDKKPSKLDALAQRAVSGIIAAQQLHARADEMGLPEEMQACNHVMTVAALALARIDEDRTLAFLDEPKQLGGFDVRAAYKLNVEHGFSMAVNEIAVALDFVEQRNALLDAQIPVPAVSVRGLPGVRILRGYHAEAELVELMERCPPANDTHFNAVGG